MHFNPVTTLSDILNVRVLRNSCCEYLTNHQTKIGVLEQIRWYFTYYRTANQMLNYRLFLLVSDANLALGYGALLARGDALYVTECVSAQHRGKGLGRIILQNLVQIGLDEKRKLIAEIWESNLASVNLHEKFGFVLQEKFEKGDKIVRIYALLQNDHKNCVLDSPSVT